MKEDDKPMERPTREPLPLRQAPRCLARTRAGTPCQKAAATGKSAAACTAGKKAAARPPVSGTATIAMGSALGKRLQSGGRSEPSSETFAALCSART